MIDDSLNKKRKKLLFDRQLHDPRLPEFSEDDLHIVSYENTSIQYDEDSIIDKILSLASKQEYTGDNFEIGHSFIDFRPYVFAEKLEGLLGRSKYDQEIKVNLSHLEVAEMINKFIEDGE